jgi:Tfp pilus assembly protein PilF
MSLLLQALQKAAKNRESAGSPVDEPAHSTPEPAPVSSEPPAIEPGLMPPSAILPASFAIEEQQRPRSKENELSLAEDDLFEPEESVPEEALPGERFEPFGATPAASPADAAAVLRANEAAEASWVDTLRERPVWALGIAAGVFLVGYAGYVYMQIFHPGLLRGEFMRQPIAAKSPPPSATRPLPPAPAQPAAATQPAAGTTGTTTTAQSSPSVPAPSNAVAGAVSTAGSTAQAQPQTPPKTETAKPAPVIAAAGTQSGSTKQPAPKSLPTPIVTAKASSLPGTPVVSDAEPAPRTERPLPTERRRSMKRSTEGSVSISALEHEISSSQAEPRAATVAPLIKDAYQALQDGKLDQAENLYRNALQSDGQNVDALLGLAGIAAQRGQSQQAIGFYERALELEPRNASAQAGLIALIGQADPQTSETRLKQLIAREPSAFLHYSLGNLYAGQNQWPAAQQAYYQAFQLQPDNPDYAYNLAVGLEHLNQPKIALSYYRKAIDLSFRKGRATFDQNRVIERIGQLSARYD